MSEGRAWETGLASSVLASKSSLAAWTTGGSAWAVASKSSRAASVPMSSLRGITPVAQVMRRSSVEKKPIIASGLFIQPTVMQ